MTKNQPEPQGFQPIEHTPFVLPDDVEDTFQPIEVQPTVLGTPPTQSSPVAPKRVRTRKPTRQAAPVAATEKPATGTKEH